jgi:hypothetical protein
VALVTVVSGPGHVVLGVPADDGRLLVVFVVVHDAQCAAVASGARRMSGALPSAVRGMAPTRSPTFITS